MPNTTYGTPYVSSSDYVSNWPTVSQSVANVIDSSAFGVLVRGQATADQTGISAQANVTNLTATFTAASARTYRTTVYLPVVRQNTSAGIVVTNITDASNTTVTQSNLSLASGSFGVICITSIETGLSGSITRKARIGTTAGTVDVLAASAPHGFYILVEDLGII